ncbi:hypothetical protein ACFPVT_03915 [Corynebacterium choanae]
MESRTIRPPEPTETVPVNELPAGFAALREIKTMSNQNQALSQSKADTDLAAAAEAVFQFWRDDYLNGRDFSSYFPKSVTTQQSSEPFDRNTFIHPKDVTTLREWEENKTHPDAKLSVLQRWVNGYMKQEIPEGADLYPTVPQPFMGDIRNPRVLLVTMNPGFHEFADWAMGRQVADLPHDSKKQMEKVRNLFGFSEGAQEEHVRRLCRDAWIDAQDQLLDHIRGGKVFIPWKRDDNDEDFDFQLPPPLCCHGKDDFAPWGKKRSGASKKFPDSLESYENGNWHTFYFRPEEYSDTPNGQFRRVRPCINKSLSGSESSSTHIAQIELCAYASVEGKNLSMLWKHSTPSGEASLQEALAASAESMLPSQRVMMEYLATFLRTAAERKAIVIFRSSVLNGDGLPWLRKRLVDEDRAFMHKGREFRLNFGDSLRTVPLKSNEKTKAADRLTPERLQKLLSDS